MYILFHVGKSGGNTFCKIYKNKLNYKHIHIHHSSEESIKSLNNDKNKIILLRDPVKRYISVFNFWLREYKKLKKTGNSIYKKLLREYSKYFKVFENFNSLISGLSSEKEELKKLSKECLENMVHLKHNLTYYFGSKENIEKNKSKIFYILEQENYEEDSLKLNKIFKEKKIANIHIGNNYYEQTKNKYNMIKEEKLYDISIENEKILKDFLSKEYEIYFYLKEIKKEMC